MSALDLTLLLGLRFRPTYTELVDSTEPWELPKEESEGRIVKRPWVEEPEMMSPPLLSWERANDQPLSTSSDHAPSTSASTFLMTGVADDDYDAYASLKDILTDVDLADLPPWEEIVGDNPFALDDFGSSQPLGDIYSHSAGVGEEDDHPREEETYTDAATLSIGKKEEEEGEVRLVKRRRVEEHGLMADCGETGTHGLANTESSNQPDMLALVSYEEQKDLPTLTSDPSSIAVPVGKQEKAKAEERLVNWRLLEELALMTNYGMASAESSAQHALSLPSSSSYLPNMPPSVSWEEPEDLVPLIVCEFDGMSFEDWLSNLANDL